MIKEWTDFKFLISPITFKKYCGKWQCIILQGLVFRRNSRVRCQFGETALTILPRMYFMAFLRDEARNIEA